MSAGTTYPIRASKHGEPPALMKDMACRYTSDTPCRRKNCSCLSSGVDCTTFCIIETNSDLCQNMFTVRSVNEVDEEDSGALEDD